MVPPPRQTSNDGAGGTSDRQLGYLAASVEILLEGQRELKLAVSYIEPRVSDKIERQIKESVAPVLERLAKVEKISEENNKTVVRWKAVLAFVSLVAGGMGAAVGALVDFRHFFGVGK